MRKTKKRACHVVVILLCVVLGVGMMSACKAKEQIQEETQTSFPTTSQTEEIVQTRTFVGLDDPMTVQEAIQASRVNAGNQVRLAKKLKEAQAGGTITIAFVGGSITAGEGVATSKSYATRTTEWFTDTFPQAQVKAVNASGQAIGSYIEVHRLEEDVLSQEPDIVFVEFSTEDSEAFVYRDQNAYDSMIRTLWNAESAPALIGIGVGKREEGSFERFHQFNMKAYDFPFLSCSNTVAYFIEEKIFKWSDLTQEDGLPNEFGHEVLAAVLTLFIEDVLEDVKAIRGEESVLGDPYGSFVYENARLIHPGDDEVISSEGFTQEDGIFGNLAGYWRASVTGTKEPKDKELLIELTDVKSIGILYGAKSELSGDFNIYLDGVFLKTVSTNVADTEHHYVEAIQIATYSEASDHILAIIPLGTIHGQAPPEGETASVLIQAIAVSG
ncbi:MAG: SGNH/GDSL hydrolase family protein [Clostridium sp.]|jgi:hypothetical protein|nr:SGNH/GDSL hydrolase family protein [Clostridium sp.]